jgi:hypothetical protein
MNDFFVGIVQNQESRAWRDESRCIFSFHFNCFSIYVGFLFLLHLFYSTVFLNLAAMSLGETLVEFWSRLTVSLTMQVRSLLPQLLGPQLKNLDFTCLRLVADKQLMGSLYSAMAEACPNLERLAMGQSFFFYPQLVADLNKRLEKFPKVSNMA